MTLLNQINTLKRLDQLVRMKSTGTTEVLAKKISLSRASIYRYLDALKDLGAPIEYCKINRTFFYAEEFLLKF
jgi:predicted DNA-binding transcriptional regulator YafY